MLQKQYNFTEYAVRLTDTSITYVKAKNKENIEYRIPTEFNIMVDEERDGGKIEIHFSDRWGSQMVFIHYAPSDLKGMFDFIAKGYNVFIKLENER